MQINVCKGVLAKMPSEPKSPDQTNHQTDGVLSAMADRAPRAIDSTAMKAFAHPLRMAMYDYLNDHGSATATMLAKHTGESTGQTSYHLRQLERHGFVTDDSSRGTGRERWWKAVGFSMHGYELSKDASTRPAVASMLRNQVSQHADALHDWFSRVETEDPEWVNISTNNRYTLLLTREEVTEMETRIIASLTEFTELSEKRAEAGPDAEDGSRRIRVYLDLFPLSEKE